MIQFKNTLLGIYKIIADQPGFAWEIKEYWKGAPNSSSKL